MVRHTRKRKRGGSTHSARRSYRRRVRGSHCRGKGPASCRGRKGCKYASGRKRSFCRKVRNTHRRRRRSARRRGGSLGLLGQLRRAAVPFSLYHSTKTHQRRKHRRRHRRRRRSRRR